MPNALQEGMDHAGDEHLTVFVIVAKRKTWRIRGRRERRREGERERGEGGGEGEGEM